MFTPEDRHDGLNVTRLIEDFTVWVVNAIAPFGAPHSVSA
jgi:hypothetical protein